MRRRLVVLLAMALLAAACTAGGGGDSKTAATIDPNAQHDPLTLTVWSNFSGREGKVTIGRSDRHAAYFLGNGKLEKPVAA